MKDVMEWLVSLEILAINIYKTAMNLFKMDMFFCSFLHKMIEDITWRKQIWEELIGCSSLQQLDLGRLNSMKRVEVLLLKCRNKISDKTLCREDVLQCVMDVEFLGWRPLLENINRLFLEEGKDCARIVAKIQWNGKVIRRFVESLPDYHTHKDQLERLPDECLDRILVVDDEPMMLNLLRVMFGRKMFVETAMNGKIALNVIQRVYFDVVVCDIGMPEMNGIELCSLLMERWPGIEKRFLFFSGAITQQNLQFMKEKGIRYLSKPAEPMDIEKKVQDILNMQIAKELAI